MNAKLLYLILKYAITFGWARFGFRVQAPAQPDLAHPKAMAYFKENFKLINLSKRLACH